jgi:predicted GIY-YIG superfamily endonuclease
MFVYVLALSSNKYYVGKTNNPLFRIQDHCNKNGSQYTQKYKPINIVEIVPDCDDYDEDKYTLKYMKKYGIDCVRGGSFSEIELSKEQINIIDKMLKTSDNMCYKCGKKGHYSQDCKFKKIIDKSISKKRAIDDDLDEEYQCSQCGKVFETKKGMTYHINFYCKKNVIHDSFDSDSDTNSDFDSDSDSDGDNDTCYKCGRKGHYAYKCYAKFNVNGRRIAQ